MQLKDCSSNQQEVCFACSSQTAPGYIHVLIQIRFEAAEKGPQIYLFFRAGLFSAPSSWCQGTSADFSKKTCANKKTLLYFLALKVGTIPHRTDCRNQQKSDFWRTSYYSQWFLFSFFKLFCSVQSLTDRFLLGVSSCLWVIFTVVLQTVLFMMQTLTGNRRTLVPKGYQEIKQIHRMNLSKV